MTERSGLDLVLMWHMHQPDYRDHLTGEWFESWTWLHALKDYSDMASHLERHPSVRAVVNFTPVLVEQLEALAGELAGPDPREPLARLLLEPRLAALPEAQRRWILDRCFRCNPPTMLHPFPGYRRLWDVRQALADRLDDAVHYLGEAYFSDLVAWYHLAWLGESVRRADPLAASLMKRGSGFGPEDRRALYALCARIVAEILPRYRRLAECGQIELTTTPHHHPIGPLLIDFAAARETVPDAPLPEAPCYPGGAERFRAQVDAALAHHAATFGEPPAGAWPAEGAISEATLAELERAGLRWAASGEAVLVNSLKRSGTLPERRERWLARPWRFEGAPGLPVFFRDDELSDRIGFEYARWHGRDAAADFVATLERRQQLADGDGSRPVLLVALDGENAWEHYPYNGWYFFEETFGALAAHPSVRTATPSEWLREHPDAPGRAGRLVAGSWVYGTLSTWIGEPAKNRAWDRLVAAKEEFDRRTAGWDPADPWLKTARELLAVAESSDWFWWLGEGARGHGPRSFDALARRHLANLYRALGAEPPAELLAERSAAEDAADEPDTHGAMRRAS